MMKKLICDKCLKEVKHLNEAHLGLDWYCARGDGTRMEIGGICDKCLKTLKAHIKLWMK
ncbi:MAG: hypothetical protein PHQ43_14965 [Dehalococcoidales bacterium]|jgi:hypothetical protein|nr:hypothetical protein [Dehalococcoidales bacterium]